MKFIDLLAPTPENDHAPQLLQKTAFLLLCGLIVLSFAVTNLQSLVWQSSSWLVGTVLPAVVIDKTNEARIAQAEIPLQRNALLDEAARLKAEDMAKNGYFAHYSPEGVSPWHWFNEVGYVYAHAGENLAVHFNDSKAVVAAWLESPTHRANIENGNYLEIGVGTAEGEYQGFKTVFVVQLFGTPAAPIQPAQSPVLSEPVVEIPVAIDFEMVSTTAATEVLGETTDVIEATPVASERAITAQDLAINPGASPQVPSQDRAESSETLTKPHSFTATSSALAPITIEAFVLGSTIQSGSSALTGGLATTPNTVLRYIYLVLGTLVVAMLLLSVAVAVRYHRPWQIAYGVGLLMLMSGLFYLQGTLTSKVALADTDTSHYLSL